MSGGGNPVLPMAASAVVPSEFHVEFFMQEAAQHRVHRIDEEARGKPMRQHACMGEDDQRIVRAIAQLLQRLEGCGRVYPLLQ